MLLGLEVAERKFQSAEVWVVVVIEGEGDIESVAGKQLGLLDALGHAPAEGIVGHRLSPAAIGTLGVESRQDG